MATCLQRRVCHASFAPWPQDYQLCFGYHHGPKSNVIVGRHPAMQREAWDVLWSPYTLKNVGSVCMLAIFLHSLDIFYFNFN